MSPLDRRDYERLQEEDEVQDQRILDYVKDHPNTVTSEIASEVKIPLNTVLTILKDLEKEGKVTHTVRSGMHSWTMVTKRNGRQKQPKVTNQDNGTKQENRSKDLNTGNDTV